MKTKKSKILLGITGSVAAYKGVYLARLLKKSGYQLKIILTESASRFVSPLQFKALTGFDVFRDDNLWEYPGSLHIELARWPDLAVIAPATFDFINKISIGHANDLLSLVVSSLKKPVLLAPAMHSELWENPFLKENIEKLRKHGFFFIGPESGELASGDYGFGRMSEPEKIQKEIEVFLSVNEKLKGKRVLIVYGRTEEPIDDVRVITNRSSGKMGASLVEWTKKFGANVISIVGEVSVNIPETEKILRVKTNEEMEKAIKGFLEDTEILIMAAAVADFKPVKGLTGKIERQGNLKLELKPTKDILASLPKREGQIFVGFALEPEEKILERARQKMKKKNLDMIVANYPETMGSEKTSGYIIKGDVVIPFSNIYKSELAYRILKELVNL